MNAHLRCRRCEATEELGAGLWRCRCGEAFDLEPDRAVDPLDQLDQQLHSLWRYRRALPFSPTATGWREVSGRGKIYAYSVMRRAETPYAIAYVTLDEGVTLLTNLIDCDFDRLRIGQEVKLVFQESEGGPPVPMFTPG